MGRFSPTVRPLSGLQVLAEGLDSFQGARRQKEEDELAEQERSITDALRRLQMDELGVREGTAPTRTVAPEQDIFRGEGVGMARGQTGSPLTASLQAARSMGLQRPEPEPKIVHPAGSFVRGAGFTEKHITDRDLAQLAEGPSPFVDHTRRRMDPGGREVADPRFRQLNDEFFVDREATPEARAEAQATEERSRAVRALEALGVTGRAGSGEALLAALEAGVPASELFEEEEGIDVNVDGIRTTVRTPEEALALRNRFGVPEEDGFTEEELRSAGVPDAQIPAALRDPALARQLIASAGQGDGVTYTADQLRDAGVPEGVIPAAMSDPVLGRQLIGAYNRPPSGTASQDAPAARLRQLEALAKVNTPQAQIAFITSFQKLIDPGGVVREGDVDLLRSAASLKDQAENSLARLRNGQVLTPAQMQGYIEAARALVESMEGGGLVDTTGGGDVDLSSFSPDNPFRPGGG